MKQLLLIFAVLVSLGSNAAAGGWQYEVVRTPASANADGDLFNKETMDAAKKDKEFDWTGLLGSLMGIPKWVPTGAQSDPVDEKCRGRSVERQILAAHGDINKIGLLLKDYDRDCGMKLSRSNEKGLVSLMTLEQMDYNLADKKNIDSFRLTTPAGDIIYGVMAHKDGRRPWVIIKCGIFCEADPSANIKNMLMHLFDEAPFNVLVLSNQTAVNNIITNKRVNFGGFYEGQEIMSAAYWLKYESPFKEQVAAIHVMGISLGGNASLFAALYNDNNPVNGEKLLNSVVAYCPAANMLPTMEEVFRSKTIKGFLFTQRTWMSLKKVYPYVQDVQQVITPWQKPKASDITNIIGEVTLNFLSRKDPTSFLQPFQFSQKLQSQSELWRLNNFSDYAKGLQTPTLVMASENDWVVKNDLNAGRLEEQFNNDHSTQLRVLNMKYGTHCAPSIAYGWQAISSILRGYYLGFTPPSEYKTDELVVPFTIPDLKLRSGDMVTDYAWNVTPNKNYATVDFKIWRRSEGPYDCGGGAGSVVRRPTQNLDPYTSDPVCYEIKTVKIPFAQMLSLGVSAATDKSSAQTLVRYLNSHFELIGTNGSVIGKRETPSKLRVRVYAQF